MLIASISFGLFASNPANCAPPPRAKVTVTFANGDHVTLRSREEGFAPVEVAAGEAVTIRAQLPRRLANAPAFIQPLDGGTIASDLAIAPDGSASLGFRVGEQPGLYRLLVSVGGRTAMLQFQVASAE